ncbi:hypothetical protein GMC24_00325 [Streptococcus sp. BIOML-A1]|nr:hypothetical protein [Streptococcus sp. BIOML-A1]RYS61231.1 hypothetical protein EAI95_00335 [Streptococcus sp. bf_0095]
MWNRITSALHHVEGLYFDNKEVQYIDEVGILRFIKFENTILMQSTGLKDKNGKEIFEGDVVKMAKDVYSDPTYYEVIRHRGGAYRLESNQHGCELWLRHTNCEVIGNIYENPELLEEEA